MLKSFEKMSNKKTMKVKNGINNFYMKIYNFFYSHLVLMLVFFIVLFAIVVGCIYLKYNSKNKIKIYNEKMFEVLAVKDKRKRLIQLKQLYEDKNNPDKSRDIVAIQIMKEYLADRQYEKAKEIGFWLLKSKDAYIRYFAGLNLLMLGNSRKDDNYKEINELITDMEKEDNPFIDLILEQKAVLFMRQGDDKKAREIFNQILSKPNVDDGLISRIREYLAILN